MKAYLITTGSIFGLLSVLHLLRIVAEWHGMNGEFFFMMGLILLTTVLAVWAWRLLRLNPR